MPKLISNLTSYFNKPSSKHLKKIEIWIEAAKTGNLLVMKEMIKGGYKVDARGDGKNTALIMAAFNNQLDAIKLLVEHNAKLDLRCSKNAVFNKSYLPSDLTALATCVSLGYIKAAKFLIDAGASFEVEEDRERKYPVGAIYQAIFNTDNDMIKFLIDNNCPIEEKVARKAISKVEIESREEYEKALEFALGYSSKRQLEKAIKAIPKSVNALKTKNNRNYKI